MTKNFILNFLEIFYSLCCLIKKKLYCEIFNLEFVDVKCLENVFWEYMFS